MSSTRAIKRPTPASGTKLITSYFQRKPLAPRTSDGSNGEQKKVPSMCDEERMIHDTIGVLTESEEDSISTSPVSIRGQSTEAMDICEPTIAVSPASDSTLSTIATMSPPVSTIGDSQEDNDFLLPIIDDSDEELPSTLFPIKGARVLRRSTISSSRRSSASRIKPPSPKPKSPEFSLKALLKEKEEMEERQAKRAKLAALLADVDDDMDLDLNIETNEAMIDQARENAFGKETSDKLKGAVARLGRALTQEVGYKLFKHVRQEREFNSQWVQGIEWLGGCSSEKNWSDLVACGFVRDMVTLGETLPFDLLLWSLEHIAFEKSQIVAYAFSEVVIAALPQSGNSLTCEIVDRVLCQFGADEDLLNDDSEITPDKETNHVDCNMYGLLVLVSILGAVTPCYSIEVQLHTAIIFLKMSLDNEYGDYVTETVEANLNNLLHSLSSHTTDLSNLLLEAFKQLPLQHQLLLRLPIMPAFIAQFRQSLAKQFLGLDPKAPLTALIDYLCDSYPFTEIKRDMPDRHARAVKYAILIFDIAISRPPKEEKDIAKHIVIQLKSMHNRIIDGKAAFMVRTEAKEVLQRVYMRIEDVLLGSKRLRAQNTENLIYAGRFGV